MKYYNFAEQTKHYFNRSHTVAPKKPIGSVAAWKREDLEKRQDWRYSFTQKQKNELTQAVSFAQSAKKPALELTIKDFPLPTIAPLINEWREQLSTGLGIQCLSGVPVEHWTKEQAELFFWCFGLHLGIPGAQNPQGHLLGFVTDTGRKKQDELVRLYATNSDIQYHCDAADVVGLLCMQPAKSGGKSRVVSSISVFNEVLRRAPELTERLFSPFYLDSRNEAGKEGRQWSLLAPCCYDGNQLRTFYHSDYFRSVVRHSDVPAFSPDEIKLIDLYEEIANSPEFYFDMDLQKGDVQLVSNHSVLHARTAYQDFKEEHRKRMLYRLWLSL